MEVLTFDWLFGQIQKKIYDNGCAIHDIYTHIVVYTYSGFPSSCNAKRHALYKHVRAQLFNSGFSVTTTDSQDFKDAYAYNLTATEYYRSF